MWKEYKICMNCDNYSKSFLDNFCILGKEPSLLSGRKRCSSQIELEHERI